MASMRTAVFGPTAGMVSSRSRPACNSPWAATWAAMARRRVSRLDSNAARLASKDCSTTSGHPRVRACSRRGPTRLRLPSCEMRQIDSNPVELAVDQRGDRPQHDADDEQDACDFVLHDRAAGPGGRQEAAYDGADDRDDGRRAEVLVLDAVAPEHEDGNVD